MKKLNKKGFTIVELVIVIAVIAILAAVLIPTFASIINKANESSDIQATREMNTFLAVANITDEVDSVLDVYEIFEGSGFGIEDYKPLYEGRTFYFDSTYNKILYVDDATGKVIAPDEHKDETQGNHNWFTLSMEITAVEIAPTVDEANATQAYSVSSAGEYAYVAETLSKGWPTGINKVEVKLDEDVDFKGASVVIDNLPNDVEFIFDGNGHTVKNITSNTFAQLGSDSGNRKYIAAGLIGSVAESDVTITNTVFENINVKDTNTGNVALLVGAATGASSKGTVTITNVDIKNSTAVGHRSVGALVGMLYSNTVIDDVNLTNVNVYTVGGRSGLLYGFVSMATSVDVEGYTATDCQHAIYECEQNAGGIKDYTRTDITGANAQKDIHSYSTEADGSKEEKDYGFHEDALYCKWNAAAGMGSTYYLFALAEN